MIKRFYIEITNQCGLSCAFCHKNSRPAGYMCPEDFEKVLLQVITVTDYIYLHVQGEPLIHPDFEQIMRICEKHKCKVQLVTNAVLLNKHADLIHSPALRKISFSLQSAEYHQMPVEELMNPIFTFIEKASANGRPYCELRFWRDDQMEMTRTRQCLACIRNRYDFQESGRKNNICLLPDVYLDYSNSFSWPDVNTAEETDHGTCLGGIQQLAVLCDGTVVPCCLDYDGMIPLGNLLYQNLDEILSSERYIRLTEGFRHNRIYEDLCRHCTFRRRFQ